MGAPESIRKPVDAEYPAIERAADSRRKFDLTLTMSRAKMHANAQSSAGPIRPRTPPRA